VWQATLRMRWRNGKRFSDADDVDGPLTMPVGTSSGQGDGQGKSIVWNQALADNYRGRGNLEDLKTGSSRLLTRA